MAFGIGTYKTAGGFTAEVTTIVPGGPGWLIGYFLRGGSPVASRWQPVSGASSEGRDYDLVTSSGELWTGIYYPGNSAKAQAVVEPTQAEAEASARRSGRFVATLGPVVI
jgi:hypothetical protein